MHEPTCHICVHRGARICSPLHNPNHAPTASLIPFRTISFSSLANSPILHHQAQRAAMAAHRLAAASCHALRRAVHDKLRAVELQLRACHRSLASASSSTSTSPVAALGALMLLSVAAAFPRAAAFFLPLVASTSLFCAAACLLAADERGAAKDAAMEVVLVGGEGKAEAGLLQVIGEANASAYGGGGGVQVGCFVRKSAKLGVDEDGEEVVLAGTLAPCAAGFGVGVGASAGAGQRQGALEEELAALQVDRLAEGVWDSYFGGWSRWHHIDAAVSCS